MEKNTTFIIDATPAGCKTPEGIARVNSLLEQLEYARTCFATQATLFVREFGDDIKHALDKHGDEEIIESFSELQELIANADGLHDEFRRAVAGR